MPDRLSYIDFATKIKSKYPEYKDVDDHELATKMVEKYPEYKEQVDFAEKKNSNQDGSTGGFTPSVPLTPNGTKTGVDAFGTENALEVEGAPAKQPQLPGAKINTNKSDKTIVDVVDPTKVDYSKARNQGYADSISEIVANAISRGNVQGEEADLLTVTRDQSPDDIKRLANLERRKQFYPTSESYAAFNNAKTFSDALGAFVSDPGKILTELSLESLTALARHGAARIGAGVGTGAAAGSVVPGIGTVTGAGIGAIAGSGVASLNLEYSGSILESLQESGIDVTDPESLKKGFEDEDKFAEIRATALKKGVPIALFDMLSAGLAGRIAAKPAKTILKKIGQVAAETGVQAGLGGAGELAGEITAGQKINPSAIMGEMLGELGGGSAEVVTGTMYHKAKEGTLESKDVIKAVVANAGNTNKVIEQIDVSEHAGELPTEVAQSLKGAVTKVAEIDAKVPAEIVEPEKREQSIELIMNRNGLDETIKAKTEELQGVDEAFRPMKEEEIAVLTKEREGLNKEILALSESKGKDEKETKQPAAKVEPVSEEATGQEVVLDQPLSQEPVSEDGKVEEATVVQDSIINNEAEQGLISTVQEPVINEGAEPQVQEPIIAEGESGEITSNIPDKVIKDENTEVNLPQEEILSNENTIDNGKNKDDKALEAEGQVLTEPQTPGGEKKSETPPPVEQTIKPDKPEKKKRRLTQQILKDNTLRDEFKASIGEDEIYYDVLPNDITLSEANTVIDYLGVDNAIKEIENHNNGMKMPVRNTVAQILIKQLEKEGDYDRAIDLRENLVKSATEQGQGIQAFAMYPTLSPEGEVRKTQRIILEDRAKKEKQSKRKITKIKEGVKRINKETAKEVVEKFGSEMEQMGKITVKEAKRPKEYGKANKIVTQDAYLKAKKALRGKFFAAAIPPELITIGAYHMEAGSRKIADFANAMVEEFGNKVKPYIVGIYDKAKEQIGGDGYSTYDEVGEYENSSKAAEMSEDIEKVVKFGLKDFKINLADIVVKHYTVYDATKQTLSQKLIDQAGLTGEEAAKLSKAIQAEFDRIATIKKQKMLEKVFAKKERAKPEIKTLEGELIKLTNLGAFSDNDLVKAYGDKMGWPKLTETQVKAIESLATKVQESPEGFKRTRSVEDLLAYQANIPGVSTADVAMSIWYANILSGPNTQLVNFVGNFANTIALYANMVAQNPKATGFIASGFIDSFRRGLLEAKSTLQTGYSPIRGKVEVPATLERKGFKKVELWGKDLNPYNYLKYVRRLMVASDVILFEVQKEMRAYQLAWKQAVAEDKIDPTLSMKNRALEILNKTDETIAWAKGEAEVEFNTEVDAINEKPISEAEKATQIKQADFDRERRVYELVEEQRGSNIFEDSKSFAARGTYNYKPEGALGVLANGLNQVKDNLSKTADNAENKVTKVGANVSKVLLSSIIPFTNIIANVANESINYSPIGFIRAKADGSITGQRKEAFTEQDRIDLTTKALIGTSIMTAFYILSQPFGDDDEPLIQITANGTGDYKKNYELAETGWQAYSIKVGDTWWSYQYTPLMIPLGFIGQIRDFEKYRNQKLDDNWWTKVSAAAGYTMKSLFDMTFLSSLNTTLSAIMDPRNEDRIGDLTKQVKATAKGFVVPSAFTQSARELESWFDIPTKEVRNTYLGDLLKDVPVARNMYFDKINGLGEPIVADTDKIVSLRGNHSKAWDLIAEKRAFVGIPGMKQVTVFENDVERFLTPEEYYNFCKDRGTIIRENLEENYDRLMKGEPKEVQEYMKDLKRDATDRAKRMLVGRSKK